MILRLVGELLQRTFVLMFSISISVRIPEVALLVESAKKLFKTEIA